MINKLRSIAFAFLCMTLNIEAKYQAPMYVGGGPASTMMGYTSYYGQKASCKNQKNKVFKDGICYNKATYARDYCNNQRNKVWQNGKCYSIKNGKIGPIKPSKTPQTTSDETLSPTGSMTQAIEGSITQGIDPTDFQGIAIGEPNPSSSTYPVQ